MDSSPPILPSVSGAPFPLSGPALVTDEREILGFLEPQVKEFGGNLSIGPDAWALFAVQTSDQAGHVLAKDLLRNVSFTYQVGEAEGDVWTLYYVDTANRERAVFWLDDVQRALTGRFRLASPSQQAAFKEVATSAFPHRIARSLVRPAKADRPALPYRVDSAPDNDAGLQLRNFPVPILAVGGLALVDF